MSDNLYSTRLRWASGRGIAKLRGVVVALQQAPVLCGAVVVEVDYVPEVHCMIIRRQPHDAVDDMTPAEVAAADQLLQEATHDAAG